MLSALLDSKSNNKPSIVWGCNSNYVFSLSSSWRLNEIRLSMADKVIDMCISKSKAWLLTESASPTRQVLHSIDLSSKVKQYERDIYSKSKIFSASKYGFWISSSNRIERFNEGCELEEVFHLPFSVIDFSEGPDGTYWALDSDINFGGSSIWRLRENEKTWFKLPQPARASSIAGNLDGTAWTSNTRGQLWRIHPNGAGNFQECNQNRSCENCLYSTEEKYISKVSVSKSGSVWVLYSNNFSGLKYIGLIHDLSSKKILSPKVPHSANIIAAT